MDSVSKQDVVGETSSSSASPAPDAENNGTSKVKLYTNEYNATQEALGTFINLKQNIYAENIAHIYSAADEFMACDCQEKVRNGQNIACGADSDCINRLTNIECVNGQCSTCGDDCQNQRFQKNQVAPVSIFKTEYKGYGMRADADLEPHTFIVEYKGEIVDNEQYAINKEKYSNEGIRHFYFMMIQDNEIIDATKMASIGRFCNHSCDPNAYVEKWVVNKRFRMGIFAKRKILKGEEITFDYNVDRYGAEPQKCYCGAANCLGVMGGKTQSESARLLPHAITEALGVRANVEKKWIKEQKNNGIKVTQDNIDSNVNVEFVKSLDLTPLDVGDVSKVVSCLLQPDLDFIVISRILERFDLAEYDTKIVQLFSRLHGMQALSSVVKKLLTLADFNAKLSAEEEKVTQSVVSILKNWPSLKARNTVTNCKMDLMMGEVASKTSSNTLRNDIEALMDYWSDLELVYRIPKRSENTGDHDVSTHLDERRVKAATSPSPGLGSNNNGKPSGSRADRTKIDGVPLPAGWEWAEDPNTGARYFFNRSKNLTQWEKPKPLPAGPRKNPTSSGSREHSTPAAASGAEEDEKKKRRDRERDREEQLILELEKERQKARQKEFELEELRMNKLTSIIAEASIERSEGKNKTSKRRRAGEDEDEMRRSKEKRRSEGSREKQWTKLFASVVPNLIKKYETEIGRDSLKSCARDITHLLTEKEMKRHGSAEPPTELNSEKKLKVKNFAKEYMTKFMVKFNDRKQRRKAS